MKRIVQAGCAGAHGRETGLAHTMTVSEGYASPGCEVDGTASVAASETHAAEGARQTPATAPATTKRKRGRPRKKNDADGEENAENTQTQAKRRLILRELTPVEFVGRRKYDSDIANQVHELRFINAIWQRRHCTVSAVSASKWLNDPDGRYQIARWAAPLDATLALRKLASDQTNKMVTGRDYVGHVMRPLKSCALSSSRLHQTNRCTSRLLRGRLHGYREASATRPTTTVFLMDRMEAWRVPWRPCSSALTRQPT